MKSIMDHNKQIVYQLQPYLDRYILLEVGLCEDVSDIKINEYKYKEITCIILSCLYNKLKLATHDSCCIVPVFKILIKMDDLITISFNAHFFEHKKKQLHITDIVSTYNNKQLLCCFFTYTINDRILSKSIIFNYNDIIKTLIEYSKEYIDNA